MVASWFPNGGRSTGTRWSSRASRSGGRALAAEFDGRHAAEANEALDGAERSRPSTGQRAPPRARNLGRCGVRPDQPVALGVDLVPPAALIEELDLILRED